MGEARAAELRNAAGVLGIGDLEVLDYRNGFLPWVDRDALEADIRASIVRTRPSTIVTFDDDGLYWHSDHIVVHERVTAVVAAMGESAPALYYASVPKGAMRAAWRAAVAAAEREGDPAPVPAVALGVEVDAYGLFTTPPTLRLDVRRYAACKLRAIRCHQSQLKGDALDRLPEPSAEVLGVELYRRAEVGSPRLTFLDQWGTGTTTS
jgi:LmbE family N-acetylglucosaminyl deacetylase